MSDDIQVGKTFGEISGYDIRITEKFIHLDFPSAGLCLNLSPRMAKEIGENLWRACRAKELGAETGIQGRVGLLKTFDPVRVSLGGEMKSYG